MSLFLTVTICLTTAAAAQERGTPLRRPAWDNWGELAEDRAYFSPDSLLLPDERAEKHEADLPFYMGEKWRYQNSNIFARFGMSLTGSFLNIYRWDRYDWMYAGLTAAGTLAFMAPTNPSPDAHLQFWIVERQNPTMDKVFWRLTTERFSVAGMVFIGICGATGWLAEDDEILEWSALMLEALGVTQLVHAAQKLTIGREGPEQGDGLGIVYGPTQGYKLFPSGTPSGHVASVVALSKITMDYFDNPWLYAMGYTMWAYITASVLYNNQHFISDVVWGAPIGYFIGKWFIEHRSSRYRYRNGKPVRREGFEFVGVVPFASPLTGTPGLSATWMW